MPSAPVTLDAAPSPGRRFKDRIYEQFARIGQALASPRRLELLDLLCQGPRTVEALAREAGQSLANTSQHLQVLRAACVVEADKHGLFVTYRIADGDVCRLYLALRDLAEGRLADVERLLRDFLAGRDGLESIDRATLAERAQRCEVVVVDVRPAEEYAAGHIAGALSIPLPELQRRLAELPHDRDVVAYCRGPYCVLAVQAVGLLRAHGLHALRLAEGVPDWRAAGLPVESATTP